jgi:hypothetical protein
LVGLGGFTSHRLSHLLTQKAAALRAKAQSKSNIKTRTKKDFLNLFKKVLDGLLEQA